jgi:hypothetical protein
MNGGPRIRSCVAAKSLLWGEFCRPYFIIARLACMGGLARKSLFEQAFRLGVPNRQSRIETEILGFLLSAGL